MELKELVCVFPAEGRDAVSNSPCGVESTCQTKKATPSNQPFLIHRVELKVMKHFLNFLSCDFVSNSPCGVESDFSTLQRISLVLFLIHRVELKVFPPYTRSHVLLPGF